MGNNLVECRRVVLEANRAAYNILVVSVGIILLSIIKYVVALQVNLDNLFKD